MQSEEIKYICDKRNERLAYEKLKKEKREEKLASAIEKLEKKLAKTKKLEEVQV
jgi:hypothetical protein